MSELPWFKFYTEALSDPKFNVVANDNMMQPWQVLGIWTSLLCIAANSPIRGTLAISNKRGLSVVDLKSIIKWNDNYWDNTEMEGIYHFDRIIQSFIDLDMIIVDEYGSYKIVNFEERQETKEVRTKRLNAERQQRFRDSHNDSDNDNSNDSNAENNVTNNAEVTHSSSSPSTSISILKDSLTQQSNIFTLYENEIGNITQMIAEELKDAEKEYPHEWFPLAFKEAVTHNARSWKYISKILARWKVEGVNSNGKQKDPHEGLVEYKGAWVDPRNIPVEEY